MSATLRNLREALRAFKNLKLPLSGDNNHCLFLLQCLDMLDKGRADYYRDLISQQVFDWICRLRAAQSLCPTPGLDFDLANCPMPRERWQALALEAAAQAPAEDPLDYIEVWLLHAYSLPGICEVEAGDVVLDCGAFSGGSSLYFARKAGPSGRVYGFEPDAANLLLFKEKTRAEANIVPVRAAAWREDGEGAFIAHGMQGAINAAGSTRVPLLRLDSFAAQENLPKVDFIKMDIEGAEAEALEGAADIIRRHQPKMALAAYHKPLDLTLLPALARSLCPGYSFALRHFTPDACESILYCIPPRHRAAYSRLRAAAPPEAREKEDPAAQAACLLEISLELSRLLRRQSESLERCINEYQAALAGTLPAA